jgi:hypothetical protein
MNTVDPKKAVHPLRNTLTEEDWQRIQDAIENDKVEAASWEELEAVNDILYDTIAGEKQTHLGVTTLQ